MIQVNKNKIKTNGVLIPEDVYIRTIQNSREGEIIGTEIKFWYDYKAYLKSEWDAKGIEGRTFDIDDLERGNIILIDVTKNINSNNLAELSAFFNKEYLPYLKEQLNLTDSDISIINM